MFVYKNIDAIEKLFASLVRPHLEYANTVWHPRYKKDVEIIHWIQEIFYSDEQVNIQRALLV